MTGVDKAAAAPVDRDNADHWALLAALRFFLASVVVCNHYFFVAPFEAALPPSIYFLRRFGGTASVLCFFVISGYSIGASVDRDCKRFYERRVWRIYPVYLACLVLAFLPYVVAGTHFTLYNGQQFRFPIQPIPVVFALFGLCCIVGAAPGAFGQAWSLTAEILYYAVAPALRKAALPALAALGAGSFVVLCLRGGLYQPNLAGFLYGINPLQLSWVWLLGFGYYRFRDRPTAAPLLACACLILPDWNRAEPYGKWAMLATVLCIAIGHRVTLASGVRRAFNYFGDVSYPLYLSHLSVLWCLYLAFPAWMPAHSILYYPAALIVAIVVTHAIDYPARRMARKLSSRTGALHSALGAPAGSRVPTRDSRCNHEANGVERLADSDAITVEEFSENRSGIAGARPEV
jgi:peptidoglycan/LPS O-acetylase OafA/YrhL